MYARGDGVAKDEAVAVAWYRRAAEQRLPVAMTQFALAAFEGRGLAKDRELAAYWFDRSARAGDVEAQNRIGIILALGEDVPGDTVQAYAWFLLAERAGLVPAMQNAALLEPQLSQDQRIRAELLAAAWRPTVDATNI